jgi:hypothetical protein
VSQAEDALIEPVLGDVAVDQRVAREVGELEVKEEAQGESRQRRE